LIRQGPTLWTCAAKTKCPQDLLVISASPSRFGLDKHRLPAND
jgi:hypothetical protein